ncbi:hypothetical protein [Geminocystis sp. NIES-3709]|uniref:hypothetical protein n=1 Tax=Geminocystis sp. NIES-3709 TaxID=1617448 RepID=UPI0005FC4610|nr:hypothetical protein [Geminocystis sp. NIES-3709]BAQ66331.1 hypothetical protein GM3709_3096 [Geminocystis sp. NIES-3709]
MTDFLTILQDSITEWSYAIEKKTQKPESKAVVSALLSAEKYSHKYQQKYNVEQLIGDWQLHFITGTKNSQKKLGNILGSGFYLPALTKITISYSLSKSSEELTNQGRVENTVKFGLVKFIIDGPCKFIEKKNIMAFDFTYLTMEILGTKVYQTNIRNGKKSESNFYEENISKQAFFSYFLVTDKFIAARGRGGGLALWKKI